MTGAAEHMKEPTPLLHLIRYGTCIALLVVLMPLMFWYHQIGTIPVPPNITLRPKHLLWDHDQWVMDLDTKHIHRRVGPEVIFYEDQAQIGIDYLHESERLAVSRVPEGQTGSDRKVIVDLWGLPALLSGRYLIRVHRAELRAVDLDSQNPQVVTVPIAPIQNSGGSVGNESLVPLHGTNRFVRNNFASGTNDFSLYQIESDQIRLLNTWPGIGYVNYSQDRLYNDDPHQQHVEVHSAIDGTFIETIPYPEETPNLGKPRHASVVGDLLFLYNNEYSRFIIVDLNRKRMLKFPSENYLPFGSPKSPYLVLQHKLLGHSHELLIYDRRTDRVVQKIKAPPVGASLRFWGDRHIYFHTRAHGVTASLVDVSTGKEIQRHSPYVRASWSSLLLFPLVVVWILAWCWASARAGTWAWLDIYVVGGLLAWMLCYPATNSRLLQPIGHLSCTAIHLVVCQIACWFLVMADVKLTTRVSVCLASVGLAQSSFMATIGQQDPNERWLLLVVSGISLGYLALLAWVMQRKRWRLQHPAAMSRPTSIGDFFLITIAAAIVINALRMTWTVKGGSDYSSDSVSVLSLPITLGIFGLLLVLYRPREIPLLVGLACVTVLLIVGYRTVELVWGISPLKIVEGWIFKGLADSQSYSDHQVFTLHHVAEAVLIGLVGPFLAALPLRMRGWRMGQVRAVSVAASSL